MHKLKAEKTTTTRLYVLQLDNNGWKQNMGKNNTQILSKSFDFSSFIDDRNKKENQIRGALADYSNKKRSSLVKIQKFFKRLFNLSKVDVKNRKTRMLNDRAYCKTKPFEDEYLYTPPVLSDLSPPPLSLKDKFPLSPPAMMLSFAVPYLSFPFLVQFLDHFVTIDATTLDILSSKFGPGISILYATFVSVTLSLLYQRRESIQKIAATESSVLAKITHDFLTLFQDDRDLAIAAGQCVADQIRIFSSASRGTELLGIINNDPYAYMMELVEKLEDQWINLTAKNKTRKRRGLLGQTRGTIEELCRLRASRLSHEALSLPPTHFFILNCLTSLILLGFTVDVLSSVTIDEMGAAMISIESNVLFGLLCSLYVLFYNTASDLNEPFSGIYQIRRAAIASNLIQSKWLMANHPLLEGKIDFKVHEENVDRNILTH